MQRLLWASTDFNAGHNATSRAVDTCPAPDRRSTRCNIHLPPQAQIDPGGFPGIFASILVVASTILYCNSSSRLSVCGAEILRSSQQLNDTFLVSTSSFNVDPEDSCEGDVQAGADNRSSQNLAGGDCHWWWRRRGRRRRTQCIYCTYRLTKNINTAILSPRNKETLNSSTRGKPGIHVEYYLANRRAGPCRNVEYYISNVWAHFGIHVDYSIPNRRAGPRTNV